MAYYVEKNVSGHSSHCITQNITNRQFAANSAQLLKQKKAVIMTAFIMLKICIYAIYNLYVFLCDMNITFLFSLFFDVLVTWLNARIQHSAS